MDPDEHYINGDVELRVYHLGGNKRWWIKAGAALMELDEDRLVKLLHLLYSYVEEGEE